MTDIQQYFTITILSADNSITVSVNTLPNPSNDIVNVYIYDYEDKFKINLLDSLNIESGQSGSLTVSNDGIYRIVVELTCSNADCGSLQTYYDTWEYVYKFNGEIFNTVLNELIKWLCKCRNCPEHYNTKCIGCKDDNECHNKFIFNSYLYLLLSTILNEDESQYFTKFTGYSSQDWYKKIVSDIKDAYNKGIVRGQYEIAETTVEYQWFLVYVYLMMRYSFYSNTYVTCIDNVTNCLEARFSYSEVLQCATDKGINLYKLINDYADIIDMGYIGLFEDNLCNDIDECSYIRSVVNDSSNFTYSRKEVNDKWIILDWGSKTTPNKILIIYPVTWGKLINIDGDSMINITDEFDEYKVGNYRALVSKNTYYNTDIKLKLTFKI